MRLFILALISILCIASPAFAEDDVEQCSLKIIFGSYAHGIDLDVYEDIRKVLDESEEVDTFNDISWGREGERSICVTTFSMQATDELYDEVVSMIPVLSDQAWVEVLHEDGRTRKTQWPG